MTDGIPEKTNGWNEWSRHVLAELKRINDTCDNLDNKIQAVSDDVTELKLESISKRKDLEGSVKTAQETADEAHKKIDKYTKNTWAIFLVIITALVSTTLKGCVEPFDVPDLQVVQEYYDGSRDPITAWSRGITHCSADENVLVLS